MTCPPDVASILLEILQLGVLQARAAGWAGNAAAAAAAADHVHNLPDVIQHYSSGRLRYYWTTERAGFTAHYGSDLSEPFEPLWEQLAPYVDISAHHAAAG